MYELTISGEDVVVNGHNANNVKGPGSLRRRMWRPSGTLRGSELQLWGGNGTYSALGAAFRAS